MSNKRSRKHYSPEDKVIILKKHLVEIISVSDILLRNMAIYS